MNDKQYCPKCYSRTKYKWQQFNLEQTMGKSYYCSSCDQLYSEKVLLTRQEVIQSRLEDKTGDIQ